MSEVIAQQHNGRVLAVLVLYRRSLAAAASWNTLLGFLGQTGPLRLVHILVYDNASECKISAEDLPKGVSVFCAPENLGTAGAYAKAVGIAEAKNCDWLLLLDQDTELPSDYLFRAAQAAEITGDPAVLVPRVCHGRTLISPSVITAAGLIRPVEDPIRAKGMLTAISSGVIVRSNAVAAALPFPDTIWLDYVDHWMFRSFARQGLAVGMIDVDLSHDLSLYTPAHLSPDRLSNILAAERAFYEELGVGARAWRPVRRLVRAMRFAASGHFALARATLQHVINPSGRS